MRTFFLVTIVFVFLSSFFPQSANAGISCTQVGGQCKPTIVESCAEQIPGTVEMPQYSCGLTESCCLPNSCTNPKINGTCVSRPQGDHQACVNGTQASLFACSNAAQICCLPNNSPLGNQQYRCQFPGNPDPGANGFYSSLASTQTFYCAVDEVCFDEVAQQGTGAPCIKTSDLSCKCGKDGKSYTCNKNISGTCSTSCDSGITQGVPCTAASTVTANPAPCKIGLGPSGEQIVGEDANGNPTQEASRIVKCLTINTGVGNVNLLPAEFVANLFRIILSISGGVALLLIITSGYSMATSQGNPEKVKNARERLTATIIGLVFIIFSAVILQIIGVNILGLPGFGK